MPSNSLSRSCQPAARVTAVLPGSPAARAGVQGGEVVVSVNGVAPRDWLEYRYLITEERVRLTVAAADGRCRAVTIRKDPDRDLGLRFEDALFDGMMVCANRCRFCFVDQLPAGLRPTLYERDDDYRLSFLLGNFVTMTNMTADDLDRVKRYHLSPLYVSVHATDPALRAWLLGLGADPTSPHPSPLPGGEGVPDIMAQLRELTAAGIEVHAQVVLCPGTNDGEVLARTVGDLAALYPGVASLGIVPVGLSAYRQSLPHLDPVTPEGARAVLRAVHAWQREYRRELGSRFVYAADELYLLAGRALPPTTAYEGFPQLENGIGLARLFQNEAGRLRPVAGRAPRYSSVTLVTGRSAAPLVRGLADRLAGLGVEARVLPVTNTLFGPTVTVSGLLPGHGIMQALAGADLGAAVALPAACLREGVFLDDVTLAEVEAAAGRPVIAATGPRDLWQQLFVRH